MDEFMMLHLLGDNVEDVNGPNDFVPIDPVANLSDRNFKKIFRFSKDAFAFLLELLTPIMAQRERRGGLNVSVRILAALRFFASGSYQMDIALSQYMVISQPSVSRCVTEVSDALNDHIIFERFIRFLRNVNELNANRLRFSQLYNFSGVVGVIDCTHVAIISPSINDPVAPGRIFVNRKGYHSLNVQLICDADLKIINVNASYPGSTHDSFIWNQSNVERTMQQIHRTTQSSYYLIGDSGYPLRPWLMTAFDVEPPPNTPEANFNQALKRTRATIERVNGCLKMRFRCLLKHRVLHYSPQKAGRIINACCVLHNILLMHNVQYEPDDDDEEEVIEPNINEDNDNYNEDEVAGNVNAELVEGRNLRARIVQQRFAVG